jgi:hypothetical protein
MAKQGDPRAMYKLGNAYYSGLGVKSNIPQATRWYKRAAAKGYHKASYKLGLIYSDQKKFRAASSEFRKAAQKRFPPAQYELAKLYYLGKGIRTNKTKALIWAKRSEANGYRRAKLLLAKLEVRLEPRKKRTSDVKPQVDRKKPKVTAKPKTGKTSKKTKKHTRTAKRKKEKKIAKKTSPKNNKPAGPTARFSGSRTRDTVMSGYWSLNGKPAEFLPSPLAKCVRRDKDIDCKVKRRNKVTSKAQIDYTIRSVVYNFRANGKFVLRYQHNVIFVLPLDDADNPEPDPNLPKSGRQKMHKLSCQLMGKTKIRCTNSKNQIISLVRL